MSAAALYFRRLRAWVDHADERPYVHGDLPSRIELWARDQLRAQAAHLIGFMA